MTQKKGAAQLVKRYQAILDKNPLDDETDTGDGYWFYLKPGLISPSDETSFIHEDTLALCNTKLREVYREWRKHILTYLPR